MRCKKFNFAEDVPNKIVTCVERTLVRYGGVFHVVRYCIIKVVFVRKESSSVFAYRSVIGDEPRRLCANGVGKNA